MGSKFLIVVRYLTLLLVLGIGCRADPLPAPPIEEQEVSSQSPLKETPPIPDDVYLQFFVRDTGYTHRVALDGRYLVTGLDGVERIKSPVASENWPPGSEDQLVRLMRKSVAETEFSLLADDLGMVFSDSGNNPLTVVVTVALQDGAKSVQATTSGKLLFHLGPLTTIYQALDKYAIGSWQNE